MKETAAEALEPHRKAANTYFAAYHKTIEGVQSRLKTDLDSESAEEAAEFCEVVLTPIYDEMVASVVTFCRVFTELYNCDGTMLTREQKRRIDDADAVMKRSFQKFMHADVRLGYRDSHIMRKGKPEKIGCNAFSWTEGIGRMITYEKTLGFNGKWDCLSWVPAFVHHATIMLHSNPVMLVGTECVHEVAALVAIELASWGQTVFYELNERSLVVTGSPSRRLEKIVGRVDIVQNMFCSCEVFMYDARDHPQLLIATRANKLNGVYAWDDDPEPFPARFNSLFIVHTIPKNLPENVVIMKTPLCEW